MLHKGLFVGRVNAVNWDPATREAVIGFTLDKDVQVHDDAVVRIGDLSLLGDHFLDLVSLGSKHRPLLHAGDEIKRTRPSVNFDEALDFLDADGRQRVKALVNTIADGVAADASERRISGTIDGVSRTVRELNTLTRSLHGQEESIARLVASASTLVGETGRRERAVREIVADGRTTVDALAAEAAGLDQALVELPRLLRIGNSSLATARPLLAEARPVIAKLRAISPDVRRAFAAGAPFSLGQINTDLIATIKGLPRLRRVAVPMFARLAKLNPKLLDLVRAATPAVRNLVPALEYISVRARDIGILYAQLGAVLARTDSRGRNLPVVAIGIDPAELIDMPAKANCDPATQSQRPNQGFCNNAYPKPGDAANPQPFTGSYPRLVPCIPPPRSKPRDECK